MGSRLIRWHSALAVTAIFSIAVVLVLRVAHEPFIRSLIVAGVNFVAPFFALAWLLSSLRHITSRRFRQSWSFVFLSVLSFILGNIYWTYSALIRHAMPSPTWNDLFFLASYVFLWIGLLLHSGRSAHDPLDRLIYATDILVTIGAAASIAVQLSFPSLIAAENTNVLLRLQGLAYPLVALVTLICICLMLQQAVPRALEAPRALLVVGIGLLLAGGTWLAYLILTGPETTPYLCQSLWPAGFLLCAVAALWEGDVYLRSAGQPFEVDPLPTVSGLLVSLSLVLAAMLLSVRNFATPDTLEPRYMFFALVSLCVLIALVMVRQLLTFERNRALYLTLRDLYAKMTWSAATDPLTGIVNHGYFMERLEIELQRAQRYGHPLALLFIDLDFFKQINDTYGHHAGDQVLQMVAVTLQHGVRESDLVGRYGGEEFVVMLPETDIEQARNLADRLRQALAAMHLPTVSMRTITMSCGVAAYPAVAESMESLLTAADQAMYRAKEAGRDCVITAGSSPVYLAAAHN